MALDGALLSLLKRELEDWAVDTRIDKIHQPSREELVFHMRGRAGARRMLLSCRAAGPRIHFTQFVPENPAVPPMFCMLLRKRLINAKLLRIRQPGLERVLFLDFDTTNDLGDHITLTLAVEIMGRHSNIILIGEDGAIVDSIKRVDAEMSSVRLVLPGLPYTMPPAPANSMDFESTSLDEIWEGLGRQKDMELSKALLSLLCGLSPVVCREAAFYVGRGADVRSHSMTGDQRQRLTFFLGQLKERLDKINGQPTMLVENDTGKPLDFSFFPIAQYGIKATAKTFDRFSDLLDAFYAQRDQMERMRQKSKDLLRVLANASDRASRKLNAQRLELKQCGDREHLRQCGDLLNANLYRIQKGMTEISLENFYDPEAPLLRIKLDPSKTPVQNAQKYYKDYRKAQTAEAFLIDQIAQGEQELVYIDTVFDSLSRAQTERELQEIRRELAGQGYIRSQGKSRQKPPPLLGPLEFMSSDGFPIQVGRNNQQNDRLTLRDAHNGDLWLHVKNIPGSHTIVKAAGAEIPDTTVLEAAQLAAFHSRARESSQLPVDYTRVKFVKKPQGAKPGMVIYDHYNTVYVTPSQELNDRLLQKE